MITTILILIGLAVLVGSVTYFGWPKLITLQEYVTTMIVLAIIVAVTIPVAWMLIKADKLSFNEYWNGYETQAIWNKIPCSEDGSCTYVYNCHPYTVSHTVYSTDSKGNTTSYTYYTTEYHRCPYATEEWDFVVRTTLGDYAIAHNLPTNPDQFRWHDLFSFGLESLPNYPNGIPAFWEAAKERLDSGKPGPVTKRMTYDNYILASDTTILKQYSDKIKAFKDAKLLPSPANAVRDFYYADKVYSVGVDGDLSGWNTDLLYLDAALGTELQGDLHLILVQNAQIANDPNGYITALKAYWTNPEEFGDNTISKNSIIVVLGTEDGKTVSFVRALTGMPLGNEYMLNQIQSRLQGVAFNPDVILGHMNGELYTKGDKIKVRAIHGNGLLDHILWGLDDPKSKFARVSMTSNDPGDNGTGFTYLQIEPSASQQSWINILLTALIIVVWVGLNMYKSDERDRYGYSSYR